MPYVDSSGNIVESKQSAFGFLWQFLTFILYFFQTLFGPLIGEPSAPPMGSGGRGRGWGGGNDRWPGSGGPGGPRRGGGNGPGRRPMGRPAFSSGMSCPPMGGGS